MIEDVQSLTAAAAKLTASPLWSLPEPELIDVVHAVHRLEQTVGLLKARAVQEVAACGIPGSHGRRTTAGWLSSQLRLDGRQARELADRAATLRRHPVVEEAILHGSLDLRQATVIAGAVEAIPETLAAVREDDDGPAADIDGRRIADDAEATLIGWSDRLTAGQLRSLGERILTHVAPQIAERAEEALLRRQEARAFAKRAFTMSRPVNGVVFVHGRLTAEDAAIVKAALDPLCTPRPNDDRVPAQRRADALIDICRLALRTGELADNGGEPPQVSVIIPFDPLTEKIGTGTMDTGERVSPPTARRYACDARLVPVVLGGDGEVLDVGRSRRLVTIPIRRGLVARDRGCAFPDCDRPPRWCDAHHLMPWSRGGTTCLDNMVLLCGYHHRVVHDPARGWQVRMGADRLPEFIPPAWTDTARTPRRNLNHPRSAAG